MSSFISGTDQQTPEGTTDNVEFNKDRFSTDAFSGADFEEGGGLNSLNKTQPKVDSLSTVTTTTSIPYQLLNTESTTTLKTQTTSSRNLKTMRKITR